MAGSRDKQAGILGRLRNKRDSRRERPRGEVARRGQAQWEERGRERARNVPGAGRSAPP
jgi:hypothetical protein